MPRYSLNEYRPEKFRSYLAPTGETYPPDLTDVLVNNLSTLHTVETNIMRARGLINAAESSSAIREHMQRLGELHVRRRHSLDALAGVQSALAQYQLASWCRRNYTTNPPPHFAAEASRQGCTITELLLPRLEHYYSDAHISDHGATDSAFFYAEMAMSDPSAPDPLGDDLRWEIRFGPSRPEIVFHRIRGPAAQHHAETRSASPDSGIAEPFIHANDYCRVPGCEHDGQNPACGLVVPAGHTFDHEDMYQAPAQQPQPQPQPSSSSGDGHADPDMVRGWLADTTDNFDIAPSVASYPPDETADVKSLTNTPTISAAEIAPFATMIWSDTATAPQPSGTGAMTPSLYGSAAAVGGGAQSLVWTPEDSEEMKELRRRFAAYIAG